MQLRQVFKKRVITAQRGREKALEANRANFAKKMLFLDSILQQSGADGSLGAQARKKTGKSDQMAQTLNKI